MLSLRSFWFAATMIGLPASALAEPAIDFSVSYTADTSVALSGGADGAARYLDNLDLIADADLDRLLGWQGATVHVYVLNNLGARPNDAVGTLQGVDNIEVPRARLRLYEAWIEQRFAGDRASLRAGLYDLNSEFYATSSSDLLIAPGFGIGTELAATGVAGPSIFPMTSLAARVDVKIGKAGYVRGAVLGARSGALDERGVADFTFPDGVLLIAEGGVEGPVRLAAGVWGYTKKVDDLAELDAVGNPIRRASRGAYVLAEAPLGGGEDGERFKAFLRGGISDGHTSPFSGGWQVGVHMASLFGKDNGEAAIGVSQVVTSGHFRDLLRAGGVNASGTETQFEATLALPIIEQVTIQPDIQYILSPGGDRDARDVVVGTVRLTISL